MRTALRGSRWLGAVVLVGALALVVGGIAWATIPEGGVYTACYKTHHGDLRIIDASEQCKKDETRIALSEAGTTLSNDVWLGGDHVMLDSLSSVTVGSVDVPSGTFLVTGTVNLEAWPAGYGPVACAPQLTGSDSWAQVLSGISVVSSDAEIQNLSLKGAITLTAPATISISCHFVDTPTTDVDLVSFLSVQEVGALH